MREGGVLWKDYLICYLMFVILYNIDKVGMVLNNNGKGPTTKKGQGNLDQARKQAKEVKVEKALHCPRVYFKVAFTKQKEQLLHRLTLFVK